MTEAEGRSRKAALMRVNDFCSSGELIGISYLYSQTGRTLQDFPDEPDVTPTAEEELEEEEEVEEEFDNFLLDPLPQLPAQPLPSSQMTPPSLSDAVSSSMVCTDYSERRCCVPVTRNHIYQRAKSQIV